MKPVAPRLIALLSKPENLDKEDAAFERLKALLDITLDADAIVEEQILDEVIEASQNNPEVDIERLFDELEMEAEMQEHSSESGVWASIVFGVPVVLKAEAVLQSHVLNPAAFSELAQVLQEASIVDPGAYVALAPRLFSLQEVQDFSFGEVRRLHRHLAGQLRAGEALSAPLLPSEALPFAAHSVHGLGQVAYLVGVAVTRAHELYEVFPPSIAQAEPSADEGGAVSEEQQEIQRWLKWAHQDGPTPVNGDHWEPPEDRPIGVTEEGDDWEIVFCRTVDIAFGLAQGSTLCAAMPDGFFEDVRQGRFLLRHQEAVLWSQTLAESDEAFTWSVDPLNSSPQEGWMLTAINSQNEPLSSYWWGVLEFETPEETQEALMHFLEDSSIEMNQDPFSVSAYLFSTTLH